MKYVEIKIPAPLYYLLVTAFNFCVAGWANFCIGLVP